MCFWLLYLELVLNMQIILNRLHFVYTCMGLFTCDRWYWWHIRTRKRYSDAWRGHNDRSRWADITGNKCHQSQPSASDQRVCGQRWYHRPTLLQQQNTYTMCPTGSQQELLAHLLHIDQGVRGLHVQRQPGPKYAAGSRPCARIRIRTHQQELPPHNRPWVPIISHNMHLMNIAILNKQISMDNVTNNEYN